MARPGGICSILAGILLFTGGVAFYTLPAEQRSFGTGEFFASVADNPTQLKLTFLAPVLAAPLAIAAVLAISDRLGPHRGGWVQWSSVLGVIGYTVVAVKEASDLNRIPHVAAAYVQADESVRAALEVLGTSSIDSDLLLQTILIGVWFLVVNWSALCSNRLPKGLAYVGLTIGIGAVLAVATSVLKLHILRIVVLALGFTILKPVWFVWVGIVLSRDQRATDPQGAAQPLAAGDSAFGAE